MSQAGYGYKIVVMKFLITTLRNCTEFAWYLADDVVHRVCLDKKKMEENRVSYATLRMMHTFFQAIKGDSSVLGHNLALSSLKHPRKIDTRTLLVAL